MEEVLTNQSLAEVDEIQDKLSLNVYPNPTSDKITIESNEEILKVELYSMDGKLILTEKPNSNTLQLDLTSVAQGNYVVKVFTSNEIGYLKVVME